jgi:hypothetical protein
MTMMMKKKAIRSPDDTLRDWMQKWRTQRNKKCVGHLQYIVYQNLN